MPRPIWKGNITFGLVNVPVNLYGAEQRNDLELHLIDSRNHARIKYQRINEESGEEVPWNAIARGYEYSDGHYVVLTEGELKTAAPEVTKAIEIESFVNLHEIDITYFDKPYYLEPAKGGDKGYVLLNQAIHETGLAGIARVVIRTRQYIAAMVAEREVLVLNLLRYAQELRSTADLSIPEGKAARAHISAQELTMARALVQGMITKWNPKQYHDEYRTALKRWIKRRVASGRTVIAPEIDEEEGSQIPPTLNFNELLKRSLAQQKGAKTASKSETGLKRRARAQPQSSLGGARPSQRRKAG